VEKTQALIMANPQITQKKLMDRTGLTRRGVDRKNECVCEGVNQLKKYIDRNTESC
jgi:transcriptional antiterminator